MAVSFPPERSTLPIFFIQMAPANSSVKAFRCVTLQPQDPCPCFASARDSSARVGPWPALPSSPGSVHLTSADLTSPCGWVWAPCTQQLQLPGLCSGERLPAAPLQAHGQNPWASRLVSLLSSLAIPLSAAQENMFDSTIIQKITFLFSHNLVVISLLVACNGILCLCGILKQIQ